MKTEVLDYQLKATDLKSIAFIKSLELEYEEKEKELRVLKGEIDYHKSKLDISYAPLVLDCLRVGKEAYSLKTPLQVAECVTINFEITASREMKNNIATTLSTLFRDKKVGRVEINGRNYYGLAEYFNADMETVKTKFLSFVEGRKKTP